jgi:hypothetical protein
VGQLTPLQVHLIVQSKEELDREMNVSQAVFDRQYEDVIRSVTDRFA